MTRKEMRNLLRQRMGGTPSISATQRRLDRELNFAAQAIALKLAKNPYVDATRKTYTIQTDGNVEYPLWDVDDLHQLVAAQGTSADHGIRMVAEWEWESIVDKHPDGIDSNGKYLAYLTYDAGDNYKVTLGSGSTLYALHFLGTSQVGLDDTMSGITIQGLMESTRPEIDVGDVVVTGGVGGPYTFRFHEHMGLLDPAMWALVSTGSVTVQRYNHTLRYVAKPPNVEHTLIYCIRVPPIAFGVDRDERTYSAIPPEYHELIIERALLSILGHDGSPNSQFAGILMADLLGTGATQTATRPTQDPYRSKT